MVGELVSPSFLQWARVVHVFPHFLFYLLFPLRDEVSVLVISSLSQQCFEVVEESRWHPLKYRRCVSLRLPVDLEVNVAAVVPRMGCV